ncbi:MAG TPA: hypothetical protein DEB39_12310, partial [Planctomycetaceae bacterium]|nr:hypothetical protein [Planctomycetaceae bacterium]
PDRIATQVAGYAPGRAVLLKNQFRYDLGTGECRDVSFPHGIDGTILHPVDANRYPPWRRGEDSLFANLWRRAAKLTAVDNDPGLYVRLYTGHNTWSRAHVMSAGKSVADQDGLGAMLGDLNAACPASGVF